MLSYAGTPLLDPGADLVARLERDLDLSYLPLWADRLWPGYAQDALGFRGPWPQGPLRLNTLVWPSGASRFAYGHYLVEHTDLLRIRDETQVSAQPVAKPLIIADGRKQLSTEMYMLPATPLDRVKRGSPGESNLSGLYLLTLVDDRYYHWYASTGLTVTGGSTAWQEVFDQIATGLGVGITVGTIHADYLKPPSDLGISHRALPILLDAAAYSIGHRVVRKLDGTFLTMTARQSYDLHKTNIEREQTAPSTNSRLVGDEYDLLGTLPPGRHDTKVLVPERVRVAFLRETDGVPGERTALPLGRNPRVIDARKAGSPYSVDTTLTSRAIAEYGGVQGFSGVKAFWSTARARYAGATLLNESELASLAQRVATDWYLWQLGRAHARYEGVAVWDMEGHAETVEFDHLEGRLSTRVSRGPFLDHLEDLHHYNSETGIEEAFLAQLTGKSHSGGSASSRPCVIYNAVRAEGSIDCGYTLGDGVCSPIYHEQKNDLPVRLPPSPRTVRPKVGTNDSASGSVAWSGASNALSSDNTYATCELSPSQTTQYLKLTNICTGLPDGVTLSNIEVRVEAKASGGSVADLEVKLVFGGVIGGSSLHTGVALGTSDSVRSYSGSPASWGASSADSGDYDSGFGVALRYTNGSGEVRTVSVDDVSVVLTYSDPGSIEPLCIVRLRRGAGDWYYIDHEPHWEYVEEGEEVATVGGVSYRAGWLLRYDQSSKTLERTQEILIRDLSEI